MSLSLWHDILPWLRPGAEQDMPVWLRVILQRIRYGTRTRVPKRGNLPDDVLRAQAREVYRARRDEGLTHPQAVADVARTIQVSRRSAERWLRQRQTGT